jgi:type VI secretion system secreted protein VgrG
MPVQFGYGLLTDVQGVQFRFATKAKDQDGWRVQRAWLKESVSGLYSLHVDLSAKLPGPDAAAMLGEDVSLEITRNQETRVIHGIVDSVTDGEWSSSNVFIRLSVVPALDALKHRSHSRIFADMTVPQIVQSVLDEALGPYQRKLEAPSLSRSDYPTREYVVQHRESDFAFAARLLAEEGIWFYFRHSADAEVEQLFLCDANESAPAAAEDPKVEFAPDRDTNAQHAAISVFSKSERQRPTQLRVRHYNWSHPELEIHGEASVKEPAQFESQRPLARYDHDDITLHDYKEPAYTQHDVNAQALVRLQHQRRDRQLLHGKSNVITLQAGHFIQVDDQEYLLLEVQHSGSATLSSGQASHHGTYENTFVCMPRALAYRPARRDKPRIEGMQTATVVDRSGKRTAPGSTADGEDIVTDVHGRVRVKFPWDETSADAKGTNSCLLRCAQLWAGSGWGAQFIPRVGMEVVVQFVDGDPDRPVITGCLYNGLNPPPYAKTPTQSGIKTASSVDPSRYNELRFDDALNQEQVFVRAQHDYVEQVLNDHKTTVTGAQSNTVKKSQTESIDGSQSLSVGGKRNKTVTGDEVNKVEGERKTTVVKTETQDYEDARTITVAKADTLTVKDHQKHTIGKGREVTISEQDDNTTVSAGHKTTNVKQKYTIWSEGQFAVAQGGGKETQLALDGKVYAKTQGDVTLTTGSAKVFAKGGKLLLEGKEEIKLVCGAASITLQSNGTVKIAGMQVQAGTATNSLKCDPKGAKLSGTLVEVVAPMVKIN